jgi:hypothetical protein
MASIRRRPGRPSPWEAVFRDPSGRQQTRGVPSQGRRAALARRADGRDRYRAVISPAAGRTTVRDYGEQWRAAQVHRQSSADRIESILRLHVYPRLGDRHVAAVSLRHPGMGEAAADRAAARAVHGRGRARRARVDVQGRRAGPHGGPLPLRGDPPAREPLEASGAPGGRAGAGAGGRHARALARAGARWCSWALRPARGCPRPSG